MNYKRLEIKDDGEVVIVKMGGKDFAHLGKIFERLGIPVKEASKKDATFIFSRSDYDKVISWTAKTRGIRITRKSPDFFYLKIEDSGRFLDVRSNVNIRPIIYVCSSCGFSTEDVAELHKKTNAGGIHHQCPNCRNYTGSGSSANWENRSEDLADLEKNYKVVYLTNYYGCDSDCSNCRGEV
jgi:hypothetical protein